MNVLIISAVCHYHCHYHHQRHHQCHFYRPCHHTGCSRWLILSFLLLAVKCTTDILRIFFSDKNWIFIGYFLDVIIGYFYGYILDTQWICCIRFGNVKYPIFIHFWFFNKWDIFLERGKNGYKMDNYGWFPTLKCSL